MDERDDNGTTPAQTFAKLKALREVAEVALGFVRVAVEMVCVRSRWIAIDCESLQIHAKGRRSHVA
jgi:hypothetical protein